MVIAQEKKKNNIAEYILYMWQLENILRACKFDIVLIEQNVINQMGLDANTKETVKEWYIDLISQMKREGLTQTGHLSYVQDHVAELTLLHNTLLHSLNDVEYGFLFNRAEPDIKELEKKQKGITRNDIEVCLSALYSVWVLKLAKKELNAETEKSIQNISKLVAYLVKKYHEMMVQPTE